MGIPFYGYDWQLPYVKGTMAQSLSPQQAIELASTYGAEIEYDDFSQAPYFYYTRDNNEHIVWFENAKSIEAKFQLIKNFSLAGCGFWNIDRYFPQAYILLNSQFKIVRL